MKYLSSALSLRHRLSLVTVLAALSFGAFSTQAHAACGAPGGSRGGVVALPQSAFGEEDYHNYQPTVVGLWHAIYTNSATNDIFNDSFKEWHIDGTEVESAFLSPAGGNVCVGVWKPTGYRTVKLHHTGWLYQTPTPGGTASNYFTVDELITVAPNGKTYTGTFTFKVWNLDGTPTPVEVSGTIAATRITV